MPYVLPKEAKTQKLESLPSDLRKLADELIGEKFKVEEVVERKSRPRFQQEYPRGTGQVSGEAFGYRARGGLEDDGYDDYARGSISVRQDLYKRNYTIEISEPSERVLLEVMRMMDMNNFRRRKSILYVTYDDVHFLKAMYSFQYYDQVPYNSEIIGRVFEYEVRLARGSLRSYIEMY